MPRSERAVEADGAAMPRVCLLLETFHPIVGGGETQARLLATELRRAGAGVTVITRRSRPDLPRQEDLDGVRVERVSPVGDGPRMKWRMVPGALAALLRQRRSWEVLYVCGFRVLGLPGLAAARLLRRPVVLKAESNGEMSGEFFRAGLASVGLSLGALPVRGFLALRNRALRGADAFVALSGEIEGEMQARGVPPERIHRIPNGVDTGVFRPPSPDEKAALRGELGLGAEALVFVYTGRLVSYKGLPGLLEAWGGVAARRPEAHLVLVGEGGADLHNCEGELRRYVDEGGLASSVTFTGGVSDVARWLRAADVFVFPTENEAFGISLLEAMATGLACITTTVGGIRDVVTPGVDAWTVPAGNLQALRESMEALANDAGRREELGKAAALTARRGYGKERVAEAHLQLFRALRARGGDRRGRASADRTSEVAAAAPPAREGGGPGAEPPGSRGVAEEDGLAPREDAQAGEGPQRPEAHRPVARDLAVVIPTLGREILRESLEAIAGGTVWPARVVVVDQSGGDAVRGWLEELGRRGLDTLRIQAELRGRAAAVNRGIEGARTRFVAVTDDDCLAEPDWVERMAGRLRARPDAIVTGRVEAAGEEAVLSVVTSRVPREQRRPSLKHDSLSGGNMGVAVEIVSRVGPLDEDACLRTAEDSEYAYRALRAGVPILYAPEVVVHHYGWRDAPSREAQYRSYARSHGGFYGKYLRRGDWFVALRVPIHVFRALRRWLRGTLVRDPDVADMGRAYVLHLLPGIVAGWRAGGRP